MVVQNLRVAGVSLLLFSVVAPALACSCASFPVEEAVTRYEAIFVGRVEHVDSRLLQAASVLGSFVAFKAKTVLGGSGSFQVDPEDESILVRLSVVHGFKGSGEPEIELTTGLGGGDCGYPFEEGETYLVYAFKRGDGLATSICSRTSSVGAATEDLEFLSSWPERQEWQPNAGDQTPNPSLQRTPPG